MRQLAAETCRGERGVRCSGDGTELVHLLFLLLVEPSLHTQEALKSRLWKQAGLEVATHDQALWEQSPRASRPRTDHRDSCLSVSRMPAGAVHRASHGQHAKSLARFTSGSHAHTLCAWLISGAACCVRTIVLAPSSDAASSCVRRCYKTPCASSER